MSRTVIRSVLISLWFVTGCDYRGYELYTAGTLVLAIQDSAGSALSGVEVELFEGPEPREGQYGTGLPYLSDGNGEIVHSWHWLGGGGEYRVRVVVNDQRYAPVDTLRTFPVHGTREDNHLQWTIVLLDASGGSDSF